MQNAGTTTSTVILLSREQPRRVLLVSQQEQAHWMPPQGHPAYNENSYEAAVRAVYEHTGVDIRAHIKPPEHLDPSEPYHLDQMYVVDISTSIFGSESAQKQWMTHDQVMDISIPQDTKDLLLELLTL